MSKATVKRIGNPMDSSLECIRLTAMLDMFTAVEKTREVDWQTDELRELAAELGVPYLALFLADNNMVTTRDIDEWQETPGAEGVTRRWLKRVRG